MNKQQLLFLTIIIEGYVVLAMELLSIRQLIPFVGSGTEVVSIIISAVLLPLAIGYNAGGMKVQAALKKARAQGRYTISIRVLLIRNLLSALIILAFGLSYQVLEIFFTLLNALGVHNRILKTAIYSAIFLVRPTFALAQTVPMVSNYFSQKRLSEITGRMLFFSTTGSFLGSVISTLVFMTLLGVHNTVIITLTLLACLILLLTKRLIVFENFVVILLVGIVLLANGNIVMQANHIVADTPYSTIAVRKYSKDNEKILFINNSTSSKFAANPEHRFEYIRYIETHFIDTLKAGIPHDILVLGAGGFTVGLDDRVNHYTFVDIDPALKSVAEKFFLPSDLPANKQVIATSARAFLHSTARKYDLVLVDLYSNSQSIPMESITREFLLDLKRVLKPRSIVIANIISRPDFSDKFSVRYYNTFASVFPIFDRQLIEAFNPWSSDTREINTLYIYYNNAFVQDNTLYTDDKNTYSFDH
jgi:spermidine synthase